MIVGKPGQIVTETFVQIGSFYTEFEAVSLKKYHNTKFFRSLLGLSKTTQNVSASVYRFIPLQNFKKDSDIDWTQSISNIDNQLYKKYRLDKKEIDFIEQNVQAMS